MTEEQINKIIDNMKRIMTSYEDVLNTYWKYYQNSWIMKPLKNGEVVYLIKFEKDESFKDRLIPKYKNGRLYRRTGGTSASDYSMERFSNDPKTYGWCEDVDAYWAIGGMVDWDFFEVTKEEAEKIRWGYDLEKYEKAMKEGNTLDTIPKNDYVFDIVQTRIKLFGI